MYQAALERLAREYAAIQDIDQESAALKLEEEGKFEKYFSDKPGAGN